VKRFVLGVIVGIFLSSAAGALAFRPGSSLMAVVSGSGPLHGWDVVYRERNGRELFVCSDPWVWDDAREIECAGE
jgi:hypothetical protein